jgi:type IV pilus assembly protein PilE
MKGFTLIELMIAVAIIGILAAIAVPSYQESVNKSRRADAKATLLGLANAMERQFTETNSFKKAAGTTATPTDTGVPLFYAVDSNTTGKYYDVTINAADDTSYTLWAAPKGGQSHDKCGTFKLTHTGDKSFTGAGGTQADCW